MPDKNKNCCCSRGRDGSCGNHNKSYGGCSGSNGIHNCGCQDRTIYITEDEKTFLTRLSQFAFLPLARFVMLSSQTDDAVSIALAPVYLNDKDDSSDTVKNNGELLQSLEDKYLITLDYDLPLKNGDYSMYEESGLYRDFRETARAGVIQDGLLFDLPELQRGSIALTSLGRDALDAFE